MPGRRRTRRAAALAALATLAVVAGPFAGTTAVAAGDGPAATVLEQREGSHARRAMPALPLGAGATAGSAGLPRTSRAAAAAAPAVAEASVVPSTSPPGFVPVTPARILDTRSGNGVPVRRLGAGGSLTVQVTGRGGVPATGVAAVVLNVTAVGASASTYLSVFPAGVARPGTSSVNAGAGATVANAVTVGIGTGGGVTVFNAGGSVDVLADVQGYVQTGGGFVALTPARLLNTRSGVGAPVGPLGAGRVVDITVAGRGGVPATGVSAVALNVTAAGATAATYITAFPTGQARPTSSNANLTPGRSVAVGVAAPLGTAGRVSLYNHAGSVDLFADVAGYFTTGGDFVAITPQRLFDSRQRFGAVGAGRSVDLDVSGYAGTPVVGMKAVVLSVTAVSPTASGYLSVLPYTDVFTRPGTSTINFPRGQTTANLVVVRPGDAGWLRFYNATGATHVVVDVLGWFRSDAVPAYPLREPVQVGVGTDGKVVGDLTSCAPDVSGDGRFVFFSSNAGNLIPYSATDGLTSGLFVRDTVLGRTTTVAAFSGADSGCPASITPDGRWALWSSQARFFTQDLNNVGDVFATDLRSGFLYQVTWNETADRAPNGQSLAGALSADARWVSVETTSTDLAGADPNQFVADVFVLDTAAPVGPAAWRRLHAGHVGRESVSVDGKVAFAATGPVSGVPGYANGPVVWNGTVLLPVNVLDGGARRSPSQGGARPVISDDGTAVAFWSFDSLAPADGNTSPDVYVRRPATGETQLVTVAADGGPSAGLDWTDDVAVNADGTVVAFSTFFGASLAASASDWGTAFVWSAATGISVLSPGAPSSDDNRAVAVSARGDVVTWLSSSATLSGVPAARSDRAPVAYRWR